MSEQELTRIYEQSEVYNLITNALQTNNKTLKAYLTISDYINYHTTQLTYRRKQIYSEEEISTELYKMLDNLKNM